MPALQQLLSRRRELIQQIEALPPMRTGSLQHQYLPRKRKDGTTVRRGPYWTYTYSENGKTRGKHIASDQEAQIYAEQIDSRRRFRALCQELLEVSQQMADRDLLEAQGKKNSST